MRMTVVMLRTHEIGVRDVRQACLSDVPPSHVVQVARGAHLYPGGYAYFINHASLFEAATLLSIGVILA
jgi:hypothetical protein